MVHDLSKLQGNDWNLVANTTSPIILFFNEPERAGISPERARDIWYSQMLPLRKNKGKKLGSPACANVCVSSRSYMKLRPDLKV